MSLSASKNIPLKEQSGLGLIAHIPTEISYLHTRLISTKTHILNQNNGTFLNIEIELENPPPPQ